MQNATLDAKDKDAGSTATPEIYRTGLFKSVIEKCEGCERIVTVVGDRFCRTFADPPAKWRLGICNFATHVKPDITATSVRVNPLKAAKRTSRRK
jgi:hypothetical protein